MGLPCPEELLAVKAAVREEVILFPVVVTSKLLMIQGIASHLSRPSSPGEIQKQSKNKVKTKDRKD